MPTPIRKIPAEKKVEYVIKRWKMCLYLENLHKKIKNKTTVFKIKKKKF